MENAFVVMHQGRLIGVYSSHRKAMQAIIMETIPFGYVMSDYTFDFGVEFLTFTDDNGTTETYELQEATLDQRA